MPLRGTHACFAWVPLGGDGRQCGVSVGSVLALRPSCGVQRGSMGLWVWLGGTGRLPLRVTHACSAWVRRGRVGDSVMSVWGQCWHRDACVGAVGSMGPLVFFWGGGARTMPLLGTHACFAWVPRGVEAAWGRCGVSAGIVTPVWVQWGSMGPLVFLGGGGARTVPLRGTHACFAWVRRGVG